MKVTMIDFNEYLSSRDAIVRDRDMCLAFVNERLSKRMADLDRQVADAEMAKKDAELTKELCLAQVQALVTQVAKLEAQLMLARGSSGA